MSIESVIASNHLILCCPLLLLPSVFSSIRGFSNESALRIRWPKYWYFSFSISPSHEYSGMISFRIDWLDLCAIQGTKESSPASQFKSTNFSALSLHYGTTLTSLITTGKTIALTRWTFVNKVMSLLFDTLSTFVIAFLPMNMRLLILWLQSTFAVILEPMKINSATVSIFSPSICHEVMGLDAMIFIFEYWVLSQLFHSPLSLHQETL